MKTRTGSSSAKAVLLVLAEHADDKTAQCFPGTALIAEETELAERTVKQALEILEQLGAVVRQRRYNGYQKRTSDLYTLQLEAEICVDKPQAKPRGRTAPAEPRPSQPTVHAHLPEPTSSGADSACTGEGEATSAVGADSARNERVTPTPSGADFAPTGPAPSGADSASAGADFAPALTEEPEVLTKSSSLPEVTTEAREPASSVDETPAATSSIEQRIVDDDDDFSAEDKLLERVLGGLDTRLSLKTLNLELVRAGVERRQVNLAAAVSEIWLRARGQKRLSNPNRYVAAAIAREPDSWPHHLKSSARSPGSSVCDELGHKFMDGYPFCVRCEAEQPNWRDERDKNLALEKAR